MKSIQSFLFIFLLILTACQSFKKAAVDPKANAIYPRIEMGDEVKLVKADGRMVNLQVESIEDGALIGTILKDSNGFDGVKGQKIAVNLSEISEIEVRRFSIGKTLLVPAGLFVGLFALYVLAFGGAFQ